jgi:hypothetical protein
MQNQGVEGWTNFQTEIHQFSFGNQILRDRVKWIRRWGSTSTCSCFRKSCDIHVLSLQKSDIGYTCCAPDLTRIFAELLLCKISHRQICIKEQKIWMAALRIVKKICFLKKNEYINVCMYSVKSWTFCWRLIIHCK